MVAGTARYGARRPDDGRAGAIKILYPRRGREGEYRLGRFRDEIGLLIEHPNFPGILPLLDSHISDAPRDPSWYVMPEARTIRAARGADPASRAVVAAVADMAGGPGTHPVWPPMG